jgi:KAP family P-loop domain
MTLSAAALLERWKFAKVASQLLAHPNVVTLLIADMSVVAASAEIKYADLEGKVQTNGGAGESAYGRAYLEKMVQLEFEIPPPGDDRMRQMLRGDENVGQRAGVGRRPPEIIPTGEEEGHLSGDSTVRTTQQFQGLASVAGTVTALLGGSPSS